MMLSSMNVQTVHENILFKWTGHKSTENKLPLIFKTNLSLQHYFVPFYNNIFILFIVVYFKKIIEKNLIVIESQCFLL